MNKRILLQFIFAYIFILQGCSRQRDINCGIANQFNVTNQTCDENYKTENNQLCSCDKHRFKFIGQINLKGTNDRRGLSVTESKMFRVVAQSIDFSFGKFVGTSISSSNFMRSNFSNSNLSGVKFERSNFYSTHFSGAYLRDAYFYRTDIRNCSFQGADLTNVQFILTKVEGCTFDKTTILPFSKDVAIRMGMVEVFGQ